MQTLLFEVQPREGHEDHYFAHAAKLKPLVMAQSGLLFLDRFQSLSRDGLILSHSRWRDEAAIASWRSNGTHYQTQVAGRMKHFADYRIRIATAILHLDEHGTISASEDKSSYWDDGAKPPRYHAIIASQDEPYDGTGESFKSVYNEGVYLHVQECKTLADGEALMESLKKVDAVQYAYLSHTSRDYGMFERDEAPQFLPEVKE